jgi:sec-independent protein translocase protein TatA
MSMNPTFALLNLNPIEILFLLGLGVLLFGRNLPQVGRSLGRTLVEFKKSFSGMEEELTNTSSTSRYDSVPVEQPRPPQRVQTSAPKFEDPTAVTNANPNGSTNVTTPPPA